MMQSESGRIRELERRLSDLEKATKAGNTGLRDGRIEIRDHQDRPVVRLGKQDSGLYGLSVLDPTGREVAVFGQLDSADLGPYPHEDKQGVKIMVVTSTGLGVLVPIFEVSNVDGLKVPAIAQAPGQITQISTVSGGTDITAMEWSGAALTTSGTFELLFSMAATVNVWRRRLDGTGNTLVESRPVPANTNQRFWVPADGVGMQQYVTVRFSASAAGTLWVQDPLKWV